MILAVCKSSPTGTVSYSLYQVKGLTVLRAYLLLGFVLKCIYWCVILVYYVFPLITYQSEASLRFTNSFWWFILWLISLFADVPGDPA